MGTKFVHAPSPGGEGDGLCAKNLAAGNVVRGIADDEDARGGEFDRMMGERATQRVGAEVVAGFAVVGKGAEREVLPQPVVAELDFGAAAEVAGEKRLGDAGQRGDPGKQFANAGKNAGTGAGEFGGQRSQVRVEIAADRGRAGGQAVGPENLARDPGIGAAAELDAGEGAGDAEFVAQRGEQRAFAGAVGEDERAVDIPEKKRVHGQAGEPSARGGRRQAVPGLRNGGPMQPWGITNVSLPMKTITALFAFAGALLLFAGCATPEARIKKNPEIFARLTPTQQQAIKEGRVELGFDQEMVKLALGDPDRVRERIDAKGKSEVWSYVAYETDRGLPLYTGWYHRGWRDPFYPYYLDYGSRRDYAHEKVVFVDGKVVSIEQERR
mgnify:FL=1